MSNPETITSRLDSSPLTFPGNFDTLPYDARVHVLLRNNPNLIHFDPENPNAVADFCSHNGVQTRLLMAAIETRKEGNYGIAAMVVIQRGNTRVEVVGANRMSGTDPTAHAEMQALQRAGRLASTIESSSNIQDAITSLPEEDQRMIHVYQTKHLSSQPEGICLHTSLEPCLSCTGTSINANIPVVWATNDARGGLMHPDRWTAFEEVYTSVGEESVWHQIAATQNNLRTSLQDSGLIDTRLQQLLDETFFLNREEIDDTLATRKTPFDPVYLALLSLGNS